MPLSRSTTSKRLTKIKGRLRLLIKKSDRDLVYYKKIYRKKILTTPPVTCEAQGLFEIHTIISEQDFLNAIWALKSFYHYSGLQSGLVFHDDGSLTASSRDALLSHFPHARVISKENSEAEMTNFLVEHPHLQRARANENFYCARKLLDILFYSNGENLLILDSDILFFQYPRELIDCIQSGRPCFNSDYQSHYANGSAEILEKRGIPLLKNFNAGLLLLRKSFYLDHLELMDAYFSEVAAYPAVDNINIHEQTVHGAMMSKCKATRLAKTYQISRETIHKETVSHHFVNNGSRKLFYLQGLRQLKRQGFLRETKRAKRK